MLIWNACQKLSEKGESFVMVTLIAARGSVPQDVGAKMIVTRQGLYAGTIGGGRVEMEAIRKSQSMLEASGGFPPEHVTWNLQRDIGMSCGGETSFLFEHFPQTNWPIVIFGAGHVAQALTRILNQLKCQLTVVDSRQDWLDKLEGVKTVCHSEPKELVSTFNPKSFFLCMTMGHAFDVPIILEIAKHAPQSPYVGVIGSDVKALRLKKELGELGLSLEFIQKLIIPLGLPLGTNHPTEIAISISAQMLQVRDALISPRISQNNL